MSVAGELNPPITTHKHYMTRKPAHLITVTTEGMDPGHLVIELNGRASRGFLGQVWVSINDEFEDAQPIGVIIGAEYRAGFSFISGSIVNYSSSAYFKTAHLESFIPLIGSADVAYRERNHAIWRDVESIRSITFGLYDDVFEPGSSVVLRTAV